MKDLVLQLIPVAVGVYIGILAGNWNEASNKKAQQKIYLENVVKELNSNKKQLNRAYEYHKTIFEVLDSIGPLMTEADFAKPFFPNGGFSNIPKWTGIGVSSLEKSVYESGIISNALGGIDFNKITKINKIYGFMDEYRNLTKPMITRMINSTPETTTMEALMTVEFFATDVKMMEQQIVEKIDFVINYIEENQ